MRYSARLLSAVGIIVSSATISLGGVPAAHASASNDFFVGIACPTVSHCVAVGTDTTTSQAIGWRTSDGGSTWHQSAMPAKVSYNDKGVQRYVTCGSARQCVSIGTAGSPDGRPQLIYTHDGGATWNVTHLPAALTRGSFAFIPSVGCDARNHCVALGNEASTGAQVLYLSDDGGATWSGEKAPYAGGFEDIECPSASTCEGVGVRSTTDSHVFIAGRTTNAGRTWNIQVLPRSLVGSSGSMANISCPSASTCLILGPKDSHVVGALTTSAGKTWATEKLPGESVLAMDCGSPKSCEAALLTASARELDVRTADAGLHWTTDTLPSGGSFFDVSCASGQNCEAIGSLNGSKILHTGDGGKTWSGQTL